MKCITLSKYRLRSLAAKNQKGVTMIEYALLAALIAVASIVILRTVSTDIGNTFTNISLQLRNAI